jgi:HEAT repeat protein
MILVPNMRSEAHSLPGIAGGDASVQALSNALTHEPHAAVRVSAVHSIGLLGLDEARAVPALIEASGDQDHNVRSGAISDLASVKDAAGPTLANALKSSDANIRAEAIEAATLLQSLSSL